MADPPAPDPRYGTYDAVCILHEAKRRVAWHKGTYWLDGQKVTVEALNAAAKVIATRSFTRARLPRVFQTSSGPEVRRDLAA